MASYQTTKDLGSNDIQRDEKRKRKRKIEWVGRDVRGLLIREARRLKNVASKTISNI